MPKASCRRNSARIFGRSHPPLQQVTSSASRPSLITRLLPPQMGQRQRKLRPSRCPPSAAASTAAAGAASADQGWPPCGSAILFCQHHRLLVAPVSRSAQRGPGAMQSKSPPACQRGSTFFRANSRFFARCRRCVRRSSSRRAGYRRRGQIGRPTKCLRLLCAQASNDSIEEPVRSPGRSTRPPDVGDAATN
jgi:hypothetical protein